LWVCGCVGVWVCGCVVCGCVCVLGVWVCGCVGVLVCVCKCVCMCEWGGDGKGGSVCRAVFVGM
jgi:hypothetical protein